MQDVVLDKPYRFFPPLDSRLGPALLSLYLPRYLARQYGVVEVRCEGTERLAASLQAGHGVLLAPNHCRDCDPMVLGHLSRRVGRNFFIMASWHLFMQGRWFACLLRAAGAFSVYREGMDRAAVNAAIEILEKAKRPLVLFPEGVVSRTNDLLNPLMEGAALIARSAAKKRAKAGGKVVVHPVALRYKLLDDPESVLPPVLEEIESRLSWRPLKGLPLKERVLKLGHALLCLKEMELLGHEQPGTLRERLDRLIDHLLRPLEAEWKSKPEGGVVARVKRLRAALLPDMVQGDIPEAERERRWRQLADLYLAQQLDHYPADYVLSKPTPERLLETVERFEEDLTDRSKPHGRLSAAVRVGEPLEVGDDLVARVADGLKGMLNGSGA